MEIGPNGGLVPTKKTEARAFEAFCEMYRQDSTLRQHIVTLSEVGEEMPAYATRQVVLTANNLILTSKIEALSVRRRKYAREVIGLYAGRQVEMMRSAVDSFDGGNVEVEETVCLMAVKQTSQSK